jgi:hypothetical protein
MLPLSAKRTVSLIVDFSKAATVFLHILTHLPGAFPDFNDREYTDSQRKLQDLFPGSAPSARNPADRTVELRIFNPFIFEEHAEHPRLTSSLEPIVSPLDGNINENSLIKFHLHFDNPNMPERTKTLLAQQKRKFTEQMKTKAGDVSYLPRDFGRGFNLDQMDMRLFKFCKHSRQICVFPLTESAG